MLPFTFFDKFCSGRKGFEVGEGVAQVGRIGRRAEVSLCVPEQRSALRGLLCVELCVCGSGVHVIKCDFSSFLLHLWVNVVF